MLAKNPLFDQSKWSDILKDLQEKVEVIIEIERDVLEEKLTYELKLTYVITEDDVLPF